MLKFTKFLKFNQYILTMIINYDELPKKCLKIKKTIEI